MSEIKSKTDPKAMQKTTSKKVSNTYANKHQLGHLFGVTKHIKFRYFSWYPHFVKLWEGLQNELQN